MQTVQTSIWQKELERLVQAGPDWLGRARSRAFATFEKLEWPTTKNEPWRYTRLDPALFSLPFESGTGERLEFEELPEQLRRRLEESDAEAALVFVDGELVYSRLPGELAEKGVVLCSLEEALERYGEHVEGAIYQAVGESGLNGPEDKLAALNSALWSYGAFVYVPAGVELAAPLGVFHYASRGGVQSHSRTLILLDDNAGATFIEEYLSPELPGRTQTAVSEILLRPGARLRHAGVQTWGAGVSHFHRQRALLERDAVLLDLAVNLGGTLARTEVASELVGPGADSEMLGVYFAGAGQHLDHYTTQHHTSAQARSDVYYKGAATADGKVVYQGLIRLEPGAQKTDAYQTNRNLLLSRQARAESVPQLEIAANDVRCSHGSSTAPVDEGQIFYMQTRGISRSEAEQLLVAAFLEEVLGRVPLEKLRAHIGGIINERLAG
ncbi:Fe-S cluster assembly protein SufD [Oceanithermus sp.]